MAVFFVNGTEVSVEKNQRLLRYLRDTLHLTSVKDGCSEGTCGACTVLIDGEPIRACTPFTDSLAGRHIITVEGLTEEEQKLYTYAYGEAGAVQCGFCIPGMVLCTKALLDKNPDPTDDQIRYALRNNYCRCTSTASMSRKRSSATANTPTTGICPTCATAPPCAASIRARASSPSTRRRPRRCPASSASSRRRIFPGKTRSVISSTTSIRSSPSAG